MKILFRRLRGLLGTAMAWGLSWFGAATAFFTIKSLGVVPFSMVLFSALGVGAAGFLAGGGFSVVLALTERKRSLGELSYGRIALWGALGSLLVGSPILLELGGSEAMLALGLLGILGAASSAGTLAIAKTADENERLEEPRLAPSFVAGGDHRALPESGIPDA